MEHVITTEMNYKTDEHEARCSCGEKKSFKVHPIADFEGILRKWRDEHMAAEKKNATHPFAGTLIALCPLPPGKEEKRIRIFDVTLMVQGLLLRQEFSEEFYDKILAEIQSTYQNMKKEEPL